MIDMTKAELEKELNDYMKEGARNERRKIIDLIDELSDLYYAHKKGQNKEALDMVETTIEALKLAITMGKHLK